MRRSCFRLAFFVLLAAVAGAQTPEKRSYQYPPEDKALQTLETRRSLQLQAAEHIQAFTGFQFRDRVEDSRIDFIHESVEDSLKNWMPVHYDHGNGVAVADIDSDGRYDIYFTTQLGSNQLYRNLGGGQFENFTEQAGVAVPDRISVTPSFADVDNDGDPDLYLTTVRGGNLLFVNDGKGRFRDTAVSAGLSYSGHSSGSVLFDFDNDGLLDIFLNNIGVYTTQEKGPGDFYRGIDDAFQGHVYPDRAEASILFKNTGDLRFEDVSGRVGLVDTSWSGDATFVDLNGDTFADLYVLNMQGDDHYYENQGGERFVDRTSELFPKTPWGAMGIKFFDYNNDGRMDLILTDMHSDMHGEFVDPLTAEKIKFSLPLAGGENNIRGNAFYEQIADGSFTEISDLIGTENFWPWGVSVADLNADGFEDVFISSSMNYPFRYGINTVLINEIGRRFADAEFILGVEPRREGRTHKVVFEIDCDGADAEHMICTQFPGGAGRVDVVGALGTRASVVFDLDDDGDLDIVTNEFNDGPTVLISDLSEQKEIRYLKIRLRGRQTNRDGLGSIVQVTAGKDVYTRHHDGKSGYLAQSSLPLYFGLNDHQKVDKIEVIWPTGRHQILDDGITLNSLLEIEEEVAQ